MASQVRSIEWYMRELEKYKKAYWELQVELDKLDDIRKTLTYYGLKRQEAFKRLNHVKCETARAEGRNSKCETTCDCDEID